MVSEQFATGSNVCGILWFVPLRQRCACAGNGSGEEPNELGLLASSTPVMLMVPTFAAATCQSRKRFRRRSRWNSMRKSGNSSRPARISGHGNPSNAF